MVRPRVQPAGKRSGDTSKIGERLVGILYGFRFGMEKETGRGLFFMHHLFVCVCVQFTTKCREPLNPASLMSSLHTFIIFLFGFLSPLNPLPMCLLEEMEGGWGRRLGNQKSKGARCEVGQSRAKIVGHEKGAQGAPAPRGEQRSEATSCHSRGITQSKHAICTNFASPCILHRDGAHSGCFHSFLPRPRPMFSSFRI